MRGARAMSAEGGPRLLGDREIEELLELREVCSYVERAFAEHARGNVLMPKRMRLSGLNSEGDFLIMPCYVPTFDIFTCKLVTVFPRNALRGLRSVQGLIAAFDARTGEPRLLASAASLTGLRTGAASAIASKYLARHDAASVGLIGAGFQARYQLKALWSLLKLERAFVYSRTPLKAQDFSKGMSRELGAEVLPCLTPEEAVRSADIVVTATSSSEPVLRRAWLAPGAHINAIGSYRPEARELDTETVEEAKVVVDALEAAKEEAGDLIIPVREGRFSWEKVYGELGELVLGRKPGRQHEQELTLFKSVGLALQDAAMMRLLLDKLRL